VLSIFAINTRFTIGASAKAFIGSNCISFERSRWRDADHFRYLSDYNLSLASPLQGTLCLDAFSVDSTFRPSQKVSPSDGCDHCYLFQLTRLARNGPFLEMENLIILLHQMDSSRIKIPGVLDADYGRIDHPVHESCTAGQIQDPTPGCRPQRSRFIPILQLSLLSHSMRLLKGIWKATYHGGLCRNRI
jgi:hypothetical protein